MRVMWWLVVGGWWGWWRWARAQGRDGSGAEDAVDLEWFFPSILCWWCYVGHGIPQNTVYVATVLYMILYPGTVFLLYSTV